MAADVHVAKTEVLSPAPPRPHVLVAFNAPSLDKLAGDVWPGGVVVYHSTAIALAPVVAEAVRVHAVPMTAIAQRLGTVVVKSVVALGALQEVTGLIDERSLLGELGRGFRQFLLRGLDGAAGELEPALHCSLITSWQRSLEPRSDGDCDVAVVPGSQPAPVKRRNSAFRRRTGWPQPPGPRASLARRRAAVQRTPAFGAPAGSARRRTDARRPVTTPRARAADLRPGTPSRPGARRRSSTTVVCAPALRGPAPSPARQRRPNPIEAARCDE